MSGANLSGANLNLTNVKNAMFISTRGISATDEEDLKGRGAIFEYPNLPNLGYPWHWIVNE